jgi:hypothetical protein
MTDTRRLWFSLLAPPAAFGAEGAFGWAVGSGVCTSVSIGTARTLVAVVSLVMLAIAAAALMTGIGSYREALVTRHAAADRVEFMALGGVLVSASFVVGVIWFGLNAVFLNVCGGMR